jgi:hypothetical protein
MGHFDNLGRVEWLGHDPINPGSLTLMRADGFAPTRDYRNGYFVVPFANGT